MAKLSAKDRKQIPHGDFAVPSKAPGSGSYPIPDASHARNALARASGKPVQGQVAAAVHRKFPGIGKSEREPAKEAAAERRNPKLEARESPATQRREGASGLDTAMSAHADQMHPVKGR